MGVRERGLVTAAVLGLVGCGAEGLVACTASFVDVLEQVRLRMRVVSR
jgi:hypothetical protein